MAALDFSEIAAWGFIAALLTYAALGERRRDAAVVAAGVAALVAKAALLGLR